jgi:hypothetical protein
VAEIQFDVSQEYMFLTHPENSLTGRFRPKKTHSKAKNSLFFSGFLNELKPLTWSDPSSRAYPVSDPSLFLFLYEERVILDDFSSFRS